MEKVCYVCGTLGARGQCYSKNLEQRSKFRDLVPLLTSGGLPLGKKTFYSGKGRVLLLYDNKSRSVKEEDVIRLRNDTQLVRTGVMLSLRIGYMLHNLGTD